MENIVRYPLKAAREVSPVWVIPHALSDSELKYLDSLLVGAEIEQGDTFGVNNKRHNVGIIWLRDAVKFSWIYAKLSSHVARANAENFNMSLTSIETLQYTLYNEESGSYYGQHIDQLLDVTSSSARKLSFVIQLSDPLEYEGGDLNIYTGTDFVTPKNRGDMIFFHARTLHEVTEVTRGMRRSLVGWVHGPIV